MQNLIVTREHMENNILPVRHLSFSAIRSFLQSENLFLKRYVRLEFEQKEKPSMLIGKAVHEALEQYHGLRAGLFDTVKLLSIEETTTIAISALDRMLDEAREKAIVRLNIQKEGITTTEIGDIPYYTDEQKAIIEAEAVEWSKTVWYEEAKVAIAIAVKNYLSDSYTSTWSPRSVEISETVLFSDFDGDVMPVPLKGILDLIGKANAPLPKVNVWEEGIVDYKIVTSFTDPLEGSPTYELQAGAFYFIYQGLKGKAPDFAVFEEVKKSESGYILATDPGRKLLQADLKELCDNNGITYDKFVKNDQLKQLLADAGILVKEPSVNRIVYRFDERKDILRNFLEIYRRVVNRLGITALYNVPYEELPNPFDSMAGKDSWKDFVEVLDLGTNSWEKVEKTESNTLDDYDF